jgi:predicted DNA-binding transcriptional regulator
MCELKTTRAALLTLAALAALVGACRAKRAPDPQAANRDNLARGMVAYLAARGELCLGKEFPLDVTEREFQLRARNAVQMPPLEHLGLVVSSAATGQITTEDGPVSVPVTRFELTETGRHYYRAQPGVAEGQRAHGDLCVAKLSLDKVVSWEMTETKGVRSAVVSYTYHIEAAPWTRVPEIKAVFPAVDRVVAGAGSALLKEGLTLTNDGWVANELLPPEPPPVAQNVR